MSIPGSSYWGLLDALEFGDLQMIRRKGDFFLWSFVSQDSVPHHTGFGIWKMVRVNFLFFLVSPKNCFSETWLKSEPVSIILHFRLALRLYYFDQVLWVWILDRGRICGNQAMLSSCHTNLAIEDGWVSFNNSLHHWYTINVSLSIVPDFDFAYRLLWIKIVHFLRKVLLLLQFERMSSPVAM